MECRDVAEHFRQMGKGVDWDRTCDTFKAGVPSRTVRTVAVAWKGSWPALREAVARGADLFVSHESICVNAVNGSTEPERNAALPSEQAKFDWLAETELVVYRCHDVWDRFAGLGVRDSWQRGLDLGGRIVADAYPLYVTEIRPTTVGELARHVLERIAPLGQNGVPVSGDLDQSVRRVATGTGVTRDPVRMRELGADVGIVTDDYYLHVRMGVHARELGFPTVTVNHAVSEAWAMVNLARYIAETFPSLDVIHIPQYCPYTVIVEQPGATK